MPLEYYFKSFHPYFLRAGICIVTAVFAVVSTPSPHTQVASPSGVIAHVSTLHAADLSLPERGGVRRRRLLADCPPGYTRPAGDADAACTTCAADYRADGSKGCEACAAGRTNGAGDSSLGTETYCECAVDEHIEGGACPTGYTRDAGDIIGSGDTTCTTCAEDYRVDANNTCVGFRV